jgi:hypothetical protein
MYICVILNKKHTIKFKPAQTIIHIHKISEIWFYIITTMSPISHCHLITIIDVISRIVLTLSRGPFFDGQHSQRGASGLTPTEAQRKPAEAEICKGHDRRYTDTIGYNMIYIYNLYEIVGI